MGIHPPAPGAHRVSSSSLRAHEPRSRAGTEEEAPPRARGRPSRPPGPDGGHPQTPGPRSDPRSMSGLLESTRAMFVRESVMVGGRALTLETGRLAKQAHGSILVTYGDTMVLVTAVSADERPGLDFFPLTCEFVEKTYAAGKIPGGFFKREARQRDEEILTCRIMDRPLRPLFPEGFKKDTQIIATVLSSDKQNKADVLALTGASAALHISDIPWNGPIVGVRVGRKDGELIAYPTVEQLETCDLDVVVACSRDAIVMVEGGAAEATESDLIDALDVRARDGAAGHRSHREDPRRGGQAQEGVQGRRARSRRIKARVAAARRRGPEEGHQGHRQEGPLRGLQRPQEEARRGAPGRARRRQVPPRREAHQGRVRGAQGPRRAHLRPRGGPPHRRPRHARPSGPSCARPGSSPASTAARSSSAARRRPSSPPPWGRRATSRRSTA